MHVMFVCHGNICRSPMGERVARRLADDHGLDVRVTSTGTSAEEFGNPMDSRARKVLSANGYDGDGHVARQLTQQDVDEVDVFVAAERRHAQRIIALGADPARVHLVSDFDPEGQPGDPLPDPWYGGAEDFEETLAVLERAVPALLDSLVVE